MDANIFINLILYVSPEVVNDMFSKKKEVDAVASTENINELQPELLIQ
ncbi:hypothetical protein [Methanobrevibacter sp.]|nr:hypothetical protein [Methanobrevibacter sp.]MEE0939975.1 hypothetical protein [Methanobrevibacter sp.]